MDPSLSNYSIEQFWHMVWQTETNTIICLSVFQQPVGLVICQTLHFVFVLSKLSF